MIQAFNWDSCRSMKDRPSTGIPIVFKNNNYFSAILRAE